MSFIQQYKTLTTIDEFDVNNIVFDKPRDEEVGGNKNIKGKRIKIGIMKNGKVSELIIPTERLYSHAGISVMEPFGKKGSGEIIGYNVPISLYSRENDLDGRDRKFVDIFRQIIDKSKEHTVEIKKLINKNHLTKEFLWKWDNVLYEKKDDSGEPANDYGPMYYAKLMYSKERGTLATKLVDSYGHPLTLDNVLNKSCNIISCLKFESIYSNSNGESLQVKLVEAIVDVKTSENSHNLLLNRFLKVGDEHFDEEPTEEQNLLDNNTSEKEEDEEETVHQDAGDIPVSDHEDEEETLVQEEPVPEEPKKKVVKKITKK